MGDYMTKSQENATDKNEKKFSHLPMRRIIPGGGHFYLQRLAGRDGLEGLAVERPVHLQPELAALAEVQGAEG